MLYLLFRRRSSYKVEQRVQVGDIAFPGGFFRSEIEIHEEAVVGRL